MALSEAKGGAVGFVDQTAVAQHAQLEQARLREERITARIVAASEHTYALLESNHLLGQFPYFNPESRMGHILFLRLQANMIAGQADLPLFDRFLRKIGSGQSDEEAASDIELASCRVENLADSFIAQIPDELEKSRAEMAMRRTDEILPHIAPSGKLHEGRHFNKADLRWFAGLNEQYRVLNGNHDSR